MAIVVPLFPASGEGVQDHVAAAGEVVVFDVAEDQLSRCELTDVRWPLARKYARSADPEAQRSRVADRIALASLCPGARRRLGGRTPTSST